MHSLRSIEPIVPLGLSSARRRGLLKWLWHNYCILPDIFQYQPEKSIFHLFVSLESIESKAN